MINSLSAEADRIVKRAQSNAGWSSDIPKAIRYNPAVKTNTGYEVEIVLDLDIAPHAAAFEYGSGLRGPEKDNYIIEPREGNLALVIPRSRWPKYVEDPDDELGGIYRDPIVLTSVWHPGVKPRPYLQPAIDSERKIFINNVRKTFRNLIFDTSVRTTIIDAKK